MAVIWPKYLYICIYICVYVYVEQSTCYTPDTNRILQINYTSLKKIPDGKIHK